jgi:hypothetical protein
LAVAQKQNAQSSDRAFDGKILVIKSEIALDRSFCLASLGEILVARDGIEPPTRGFSIRCSTN